MPGVGPSDVHQEAADRGGAHEPLPAPAVTLRSSVEAPPPASPQHATGECPDTDAKVCPYGPLLMSPFIVLYWIER